MRSAVLLLLALLSLAALCRCDESPSSPPNGTTVQPTTSAPPLKGSKWGLVVVCVCGGVLVIAGTFYAVSEIRECCAAPPPARRGAKDDDHGHSHDGKKKEKKDKEHGHSHDERKKDKKEKHGHSHDEKKKSKTQKQDAEKQSLLAGEDHDSDDDDHGHSHV